MITTNMPHITDYSDTYYVEENTHAYRESTAAGYDPQKAICTYPIPRDLQQCQRCHSLHTIQQEERSYKGTRCVAYLFLSCSML